MKTKELIRRLQENDPSGELECCVENADIHYIDVLPAYYDGTLQVLKREKGHVIGAKYVDEGEKVVIHPLSIDDAIFNNEDLIVEFEVSEESEKRYREVVEHRRRQVKETKQNVECGSFVEYIKKRLGNTKISDDVAREFFNQHMSYKDPMPEDIAKMKVGAAGYGASWDERRCAQWDREISIDFMDGEIILKKG